jgi:hypothetical protein
MEERLSITEADDQKVTFVIAAPASEDDQDNTPEDDYSNPGAMQPQRELTEQEVMSRSISRKSSQVTISIPIKEVAPEIRNQLTRFKRTYGVV